MTSLMSTHPHGRCKHTVNIATIVFKEQDLPDRVYIGRAFYKVKPYIPLPHQCQTAEDSDIQQNSVDPLHVALSVPHLAIPVQTILQQYTSVQTAPKNIMLSSEAVLFINLNQRLLPSASNMT